MKLALVLIVIFLPLSLWAQGGEVIVIRNSQPQNAPATSPESASPSQENPKEVNYELSPDQVDETFVDSAQEFREERAKEVEKITEIAPQEIFDPVAELKALGHDSIDSRTMLDERTIPIFVRMFKESNLDKQDPATIKAMLHKQFANQPIGALFKRCEKCTNIFVDVLRDKEALPGLLRIITLKKHLKKYFYVWVGLFLFFFWLRGKLISRHLPFFTKVFRSLSLSLMFSCLTLYVFHKMFEKETSPTVAIIGRHL